MRIAVVSSDGSNVDGHFGKADSFFIYELGSTGSSLIEERTVQPFSDEIAGHAFNRDRFAQVKAALEDCRQVYMTKIGARPAEELVKAGIQPVVYEGPIAGISSK
jgi:predicted Fe-Mo cluster-binding NifX family protein